ncbi:MAG: hypothetical protein SGI90_11485 [Candidatus Eisenbacteria bacterium]|nr:hypothetical protein [Candidatus Eisenbacteria bacterium]
MKRRFRIRRYHAPPGLAVVWLVWPLNAYACPVCFGEPDSSQTRGLQAAILLLGGVAGLLVTGIAAMVFTIRRRAGRNAP